MTFKVEQNFYISTLLAYLVVFTNINHRSYHNWQFCTGVKMKSGSSFLEKKQDYLIEGKGIKTIALFVLFIEQQNYYFLQVILVGAN